MSKRRSTLRPSTSGNGTHFRSTGAFSGSHSDNEEEATPIEMNSYVSDVSSAQSPYGTARGSVFSTASSFPGEQSTLSCAMYRTTHTSKGGRDPLEPDSVSGSSTSPTSSEPSVRSGRGSTVGAGKGHPTGAKKGNISHRSSSSSNSNSNSSRHSHSGSEERGESATAPLSHSSSSRRRHNFPLRRRSIPNHTPTTAAPVAKRGGLGQLRRPVLTWKVNFRVLTLTSTTGGRIFSGGDPNGGISVWDSRTGRREYTIEGHQGAVLALAALPSMDALLSGGSDGTVRLFSLRTLQNVLVMEGHTRFVSCVACGSDGVGLALFSGGDDGTVRQWCAITGNCLHVYTGHNGPINALCCLQDVKQVASVGEDGYMRIWSVATHKSVSSVKAHPGPAWCIAVLDSDKIVTGGSETATAGVVRVWTISTNRSPRLLRELRGVVGLQTVHRLLTYRHFLFTAGGKGELNMWDTNTGEVIATLMYHSRRVTGITLENNKLCASSLDHTFSRWSMRDLLGSHAQPTQPYQPLLSGIANLPSEAEAFMEEPNKRMAKKIILQKENRERRDHLGGENNTARETGDFLSVTPAEAALLHQELPLAFIRDQLKYYHLDARWWLELLVFTVVLICATLLYGVFTSVENRLFLSEGIQSQLTYYPFLGFRNSRTFPSVDSADSFFKWLELVVVDLWNDRVSESPFPTLSGNNILLTTMNLQVQRVQENSCTWDSNFLPKGNTTPSVPDCYADAGVMLNRRLQAKDPFLCPTSATLCTLLSNEEKKNFTEGSALMADQHPEVCNALPYGADCNNGFRYDPQAGVSLNRFGKGGYSVDFIFTENATVQRRRVQALEELGFIDDLSTRYVAVHLYLYNPNLDIFLGLHYTVDNTAVGSWRPLVVAKGFELFNADTMGYTIALNCLIFLGTLTLLGLAIDSLIRAIRHRRVWHFLLRFWLFFDIAWYTLVFISVGYYFKWIQISNTVDVRELVSLSAADRLHLLLPQREALRDKLHTMCDAYSNSSKIAAVAIVCIYGKAFFFLLQLEFSRAYRFALSHLRYLVLIPLFIFCVSSLYTAQALRVLNGNTYSEFSTFSYAYFTLMNYFIGGFTTKDFATMYDTNEVMTAVLFVIFLIYFQIILAGLFTSTIIESYKVATRATPSAPLAVGLFTFFSQIRRRLSEIRYKIAGSGKRGQNNLLFLSRTAPYSEITSHKNVKRYEGLIVRRLMRKIDGLLDCKLPLDGKEPVKEEAEEGAPTSSSGGRTLTGTGSGSTTSRARNMESITHHFNVAGGATFIGGVKNNYKPAGENTAAPSSGGSSASSSTTQDRQGRTSSQGDPSKSMTMTNGRSIPRSLLHSSTSLHREIHRADLRNLPFKQADLLSLLFRPDAVEGESEKVRREEEEWEALEERDSEGKGGISALAREVISILWEGMAYQYHVHVTYKDSGSEEAVGEELDRVHTALNTMKRTMQLVQEVQQSLDGNEGALRPLVVALEKAVMDPPTTAPGPFGDRRRHEETTTTTTTNNNNNENSKTAKEGDGKK